MPFTKMGEITEKFVGQPYDLNSVLTPAQVWAKLDAPAEQVRVALNELIDALNLVSSPNSTTKSLTYYVDVTLGDDANEGTSTGAGNAFKTLTHALSVIPQIVNHTVIIIVAAGDYSGEGIISFNGRYGSGKVLINGSNFSASIARSFSFINNKLTTQIYKFKLIGTGEDNVSIDNSSFVMVSNCEMVNLSAYSGIRATQGSVVKSLDNTISYRANGIDSQYGSNVVSYYDTGSGNSIGLSATYGGDIRKNVSSIVGTTAEYAAFGGQIL